MEVISTNIAQPQTITWKGKKEKTGIYKIPVQQIYLGESDVKGDSVVDRKYHGGKDKACYLYSANHYPFWKEKYPNLDWHWGIFGENLTVENLDEESIYVGDIYEVGEAIIQISEPRLPCYKLGIRFNNSKIIKEFTTSTFCGAYTRVLKEGKVKPKDGLLLKEKANNIRLSELYQLMTLDKKNEDLINKALAESAISEDIKSKFV